MPTLTTSDPSAPDVDRLWRYRLRCAVRDAEYPDRQLDNGRQHAVNRRAAQAVLQVLVDLCAHDGSMKYGTASSTIEDRTGLSESHVRRTVAYLIALGYISRERSGGGRAATLYAVHVDVIHSHPRPGGKARRPRQRGRASYTSPRQPSRGTTRPQDRHPAPPASVIRADRSFSAGLVFDPCTPAESARYDCGHGFDLRCRTTHSGAPSCPGCRRGAPCSPGHSRGAGDVDDARRTSRRQQRKTSRRGRR